MLNRYKNYPITLLQGFMVFNPKGFVASEQKELIITAVVLMLIAVIPAIALTFFFAFKYRDGKKNKYTPNVDHNTPAQLAWVGLLITIIAVIAVMAWKGSHRLDPRKPIASDKNPITIQVVALQWRWLFIYPEQEIATINYIRIPEDTPINFEITADAPMNSFWIPQLGGQMYAMNGMKTTLHLIADEPGTYRGQSSNISGEGFSGMKFLVQAESEKEFNAWIETSRFYANNMDYEALAKPSTDNAIAYYIPQSGLFDSVLAKYMIHDHEH
jgi:cytochrome o ubiquinol oxidase subunit II